MAHAARSLRTALPLPAVLASLMALACHRPLAPGAASAEPRAGGAPATPDDPGALFVRAYHGQQEDAERSLALLRSLDQAGWAVPLDPRDFPALRERPELAALAARFAARAPTTPHAPLAHTLAEPGLVAEGIAADPRDGALYVGSVRLRKIVRVDPGGAVRDLVAPGTRGLGSVLGLKVDAARGLLWAAANARADAATGEAGRSGVYAFDLASGALRRSAVLDGPGHLLNDLAIAEDGTVIVTESAGGKVYRLDPGAAALAPVAEGHRWVYPNGLAFSEGRLLVADAMGLWRVPLEGRAPRPLRAPGAFPLAGIDGLAAAGRTLVAVQNGLGAPRVIRVELEPGAAGVRKAEVLEAGNPGWHVPTTGALVPGAFVYLGNSHVDGWRDGALAPEGMEPTRIYRLALEAGGR